MTIDDRQRPTGFPSPQVAKRLEHVAAELMGIVAEMEDPTRILRDLSHNEAEDAALAAFFRERLRQRRLRSNFFPRDLLGEPAWDLLMDLFVSEAGGLNVSVSSACLAAHVPPTTGLRYLGRLEAAGLLERAYDQGDQRRVNVRLTPRARQGLRDWAQSLPYTGDVGLRLKTLPLRADR